MKVWAVRRLPEEEQWDSERIRRIRGSRKSWDRDIGGDSHRVDVGDEEEDPEEVEFLPQTIRKGERKAMYLSRRDFARHGYTDGCVGCKAISSGKKGRTSNEQFIVSVITVCF